MGGHSKIVCIPAYTSRQNKFKLRSKELPTDSKWAWFPQDINLYLDHYNKHCSKPISLGPIFWIFS